MLASTTKSILVHVEDGRESPSAKPALNVLPIFVDNSTHHAPMQKVPSG